jgi:hypothetical protein
MDWLWPLYEKYIRAEAAREGIEGEDGLQEFFFQALVESTATLFVMEPIGDTIKFRGLGRWPLMEVPDLLADPNAFIDERFGGGKFKINFHHFNSFVCTHNFRTYSEETWRELEELFFD